MPFGFHKNQPTPATLLVGQCRSFCGEEDDLTEMPKVMVRVSL